MTINKHALRQTAEKAQEHGVFNMDIHSETVLALLDELEDADKLIDTLRQDKDKVIDMSIERVNKLLSRAEAAEKRIAELELKLESADKLQDSAFRHGLQHGFSFGQTDNQAGFEECLSAYGARGKDNG